MNSNTFNSDEAGKIMPHNGQILANYILANGINRSELARKMHVSSTSVYQYADSPTLQMNILWKASLALQHNFLAELAEKLAVQYTSRYESELEAKVIELQKELDRINIELSVYKSIAGK